MLDRAKNKMRSTLSKLLILSPHKAGDDIEHGRYGICRVAYVDVIPSSEHGALWEFTVFPFKKDGKPGARKVTYLAKITQPQ